MLTITIGTTKKNEYAIINGKAIRDSNLFRGEKDYKYFLSLWGHEGRDELTRESFASVGMLLSGFYYSEEQDFWNDSDIGISVYCDRHFDAKYPSVRMSLRIDYEEWNKPWSPSNFIERLKTTIIQLEEPKMVYYEEHSEGPINGFGITYLAESNEMIVKNGIDKTYQFLEKCINDTNRYLRDNINKDSLVTYFNFPKEVQTACNQYLVYFTQFLADMGIEANTEITKEANQTLFKVTPLDKNEALSKIQDAVNIYLRAPNFKDFEIQTVDFNDIAVKQWEANIYHLKSQLAIANSILQAKDATIEALQLSNYQYKGMLDKSNSGSKEDLIKDIVSVKHYEGKGFSINFPELLRRLKRKF